MFVYLFILGADSFIVTLEVFSGVPDPHWTIPKGHPAYGEIKRLLSSATTYKPEDAPPKLGYEGFIVQEVKKGEKQPKVLVVGPKTESLQLLLLQNVPDRTISTTIKSIVEKEIRGGKVSAAKRTVKRYAPPYDPAIWNDGDHVVKNNCYNYASTIRTDTFAQPGDGSGQSYPWPFYKAEDIKKAAEADGCVFKKAQKHMCAPSGDEHLVALVVYLGKLKLNSKIDYVSAGLHLCLCQRNYTMDRSNERHAHADPSV